MKFEVFINFDGNCREAVEFYARVFKTKVRDLMTYKEAPPVPGYTVPEADRDKVMYAGIQFSNMVAMFMDMPAGMPLIKGNNIIPTLSMSDKEEVKRVFRELAASGRIDHELEKTFYSELYGMVTDRFGVSWQFLYMSSASNS